MYVVSSEFVGNQVYKYLVRSSNVALPPPDAPPNPIHNHIKPTSLFFPPPLSLTPHREKKLSPVRLELVLVLFFQDCDLIASTATVTATRNIVLASPLG